MNLISSMQTVRTNHAFRSYIRDVIKYCEKHPHLIKILSITITKINKACFATCCNLQPHHRPTLIVSRKDRYNPKILKYHVVVDEDNLDEDIHEEREHHESTKANQHAVEIKLLYMNTTLL